MVLSRTGYSISTQILYSLFPHMSSSVEYLGILTLQLAILVSEDETFTVALPNFNPLFSHRPEIPFVKVSFYLSCCFFALSLKQLRFELENECLFVKVKKFWNEIIFTGSSNTRSRTSCADGVEWSRANCCVKSANVKASSLLKSFSTFC